MRVSPEMLSQVTLALILSRETFVPTAYALGRPLSFGDHAAIDSMTVQFRKRGDRLGDLVNLIIRSELFHAK